MGKVGISLDKVSANLRSCAKPGCHTGSYKISRHHKGHQFMFVSAFVRSRYNEPRYRDFVDQYYKFDPHDIVRICANHHIEIHVIYDHIIQKDLARTGKKLYQYTWKEATHLMDLLEKRCVRWMKEKTPGSKPTKKRRTKGGYQSAVADLKKQWGK